MVNQAKREFQEEISAFVFEPTPPRRWAENIGVC
ncbi:MAG: hypothetical protein US88_C0015G0005 [Parcubacteria group bacterium GW2011_GWA2_38_27]|nr:MAG: hypothetical protein US88_C0015G0005 [Parcubacteria group bacterium GW2011_GWA2_38_27]